MQFDKLLNMDLLCTALSAEKTSYNYPNDWLGCFVPYDVLNQQEFRYHHKLIQ